MELDIPRLVKLRYLGVEKYKDSLLDAVLNIIYNNVLEKDKLINPSIIQKIERMVESYNKEVILLKLLNKILINSDMPTIDNLFDFKLFPRKNLLADKNIAVIEEMKKEIFGPFDKEKCGFYRRKATKGYVVVLLRAMAKEMGHIFVSKQTSNKDLNKGQYYIYSLEPGQL